MTHINQRRDTAANWTAADPVLQLGEVGWETDTRKAKIGDGSTAWTALDYIVEEGVVSVNGETGVVTLDKADIGLANVDNTPDSAKPVSTLQAAALAIKADLASPTFTGDPKAPTPAADDDDTSIATTSYVQTELADYADDVVVMTNKDLSDATNEFPPYLATVLGIARVVTDAGPIAAASNYLSVSFTEVVGAVYRVTAYMEASNAADDYTTVTIYEDDGAGADVTEVAEGILTHVVTSRRGALCCVGTYTGADAGARRFRVAVAGSGAGSTFHGTQTPSLLIVERIG